MAEKEGSDLKCCAGICLLVIILIGVYFFMDSYDPDPTIKNNTTVVVDGIKFTVPKTENYTIQENERLWHEDDWENFGATSNITEGNAYRYHDPNHGIEIFVSDSNRTSYGNDSEGRSVLSGDGTEDGRTFVNVRHMGNKTVVTHVFEQKQLGTKIINSATWA